MSKKKKMCKQCERNLPVIDFNLCRGNFDGLQWACRECQKNNANARKLKFQKKWAEKSPYDE